MGLIYVNPEGPNGNPDPVAAARDIRETFGRMAMNDEETVALIAGGHTFGKTHGAADPEEYVGPEPEAAPLEEQGLGWHNSFGSGNAGDDDHLRPGGHLDHHPPRWDNAFFDILFGYEWELTESPAGANQWQPKDGAGADTVPVAHDPTKHPTDDAHHRPVAALRPDLRADLAALPRAPDELRRRVRPRLVQAHPPRHGPGGALPRPGGARREADLAGPDPGGDHELVGDAEDVAELKEQILASASRSPSWCRPPGRRRRRSAAATSAAAPTGRASGWSRRRTGRSTTPRELAKVLGALEGIQQAFNAAQTGGKQVSLADLIVLGGCAAVEQAAKDGGDEVEVPFTPGRVDATRSRPTWSRSPRWSRPPTGSATTCAGSSGCRPSTC